MTGFGRGKCKFQNCQIAAEIKTLNQRYFEFSCRLPSNLSFLESRIKEYIHKKIRRGRVSINLILGGLEDKAKGLRLDEGLARRYHRLLLKLARELNLKKEISLTQIMSFPDVVIYEPQAKDYSKMWLCIKKAIDISLRRVIESRQREGQFLCKDLVKRIGAIKELVERIDKRTPLVLRHHHNRLKRKIDEISKGRVRLQKDRLELEIALFARNCDISEEVIRIKAHLGAFKKALLSKNESGRRLDFIAQELFREANTIGSKAQDGNISRWMVEIKEEIEKIREQVQNIE